MGTVIELEGIARDVHTTLAATFAAIRDQQSEDDVLLLLIKAASLLTRAKGTSQAVFETSEELKRGSSEAQAALNGTWMELENLLWERDFLRGEVAANANFRHETSVFCTYRSNYRGACGPAASDVAIRQLCSSGLQSLSPQE